MNRPVMRNAPPVLPCTLGAGEARRLLLKRFEALREQIEGVQCAEVDAIHDMRVASRRLRAGLAEFRRNFDPVAWDDFRDAVREITRALGKARELDVTLALVRAWPRNSNGSTAPALEFLAERLTRERGHCASEVQDAAFRAASSEFNSALVTLLQIEGPAAVCHIDVAPRRLRKLFRKLDTFYRNWKVSLLDDDLHAVRIRFKKFRYAAEVHADLYGSDMKAVLKPLKKAQEALGAWNDHQVLKRYLVSYAEACADPVSDSLRALGAEIDCEVAVVLEPVRAQMKVFFAADSRRRILSFVRAPAHPCCNTQNA